MDFYRMFKTGINLGGWLSQFEENNTNHYKTFITEEDIKIISDWGADHIRLPVDYSIIQENAPPYNKREEGFYYIDRFLEWCKKQNLNVVLDLHRAAGQVYGDTININPLLFEDVYRKRFLTIWESFSRRYKNVGDWLAFELLNEITDSTGYLWNQLYFEAVSVIRKVDKERIIVVGSDNSNSIFTLKELSILEDKRIVYNFHYYEPLVFTHQKAHFSEDMRCYNKEIQYPGEIPELGDYLYKRPEFAEKLGMSVWENNDKNLMEKYFGHVNNFLKYTGQQLYCGEFGVIDTAPEQSACRWVHDLIELLESYKIGRAYWSYKEMDFGLVDRQSTVKRADLIKQLF